MTREQAIKQAQTAVLNNYGGHVREGRKWLIGKAPDCYGESHYSTDIYVLEGRPAKGYVIDLGGFHSGIVVALSLTGNAIKKCEYTK